MLGWGQGVGWSGDQGFCSAMPRRVLHILRLPWGYHQGVLESSYTGLLCASRAYDHGFCESSNLLMFASENLMTMMMMVMMMRNLMLVS